MTNEKAELPNDQVSLPPTYAPSETFTDSPPPAYRKSGMAAVKVARIVCFTFLAMTFVIGFFVVTHKWIQGRECNCNQETSGNIHHAAFLSQTPSLLQSNLDNDRIEDNIVRKEGEENKILLGDSRQKEEEDITEEQVIDSPEGTPKEEEEENIEELNNDLELPKDLLLGNPQLAGRNVHCKVEKRQRRITERIMTQAIIVTCDDDDDDDGINEPGIEPQMSLVPIQPPMSLLSTIMKVLSTRPPSVEDESTEEPERLPFPMSPMNRPLPGPAPVQRSPLPWIQPMDRPFFRPFPGPITPVLVPLKNVEMNRHFHANQKEEEESNQPGPFQQSPSLAGENRVPRIHGMAPPLRIIQRSFPGNRQGPPFPLPPGAFPIRVIRLSPREEEAPTEEEETPQENPQDFDLENQRPMPLHPLMRFFPQGGRIIRLRPRPTMGESENEPLPFPFPRGALPPPPSEGLSVPHPMPEATGRALPSPVALPQGVRVVRLPFRPPQPFPEAKLITHMEVRQPQEETQEPQNKPQLQNIPENQSFQENTKEFGPPKTHTVLDNNTPLVYGDGQAQEEEQLPEIFPQEPITQSDPQPRFVAPPPPRFAREGRTSFHAQLNPDAEVIPQHPIPNGSQPVHRIVLN